MLKLQSRLYVTYAVALFMILLIGAVSLYFISTLGVEIRSIAGRVLPSLEVIISQSQRNMLLILLMILGGSLIVFLVAPHRAVSPFRKLLKAFGEAQDGNLSVRLSLDQGGDIGDMSLAFNKLMGQLENIDEIRLKKIAFEQRRFEVLANLLDYAVFIVNVEGEMLFANSQVYRAFNLSSQQLMGLSIEQTPLPAALTRLLKESISRKERVEDMPWELVYKKEEADVRLPLIVDILPITRHSGEVVNMLILLEERDKPRAERLFRREGK